jgi:hypothetical protein
MLVQAALDTLTSQVNADVTPSFAVIGREYTPAAVARKAAPHVLELHVVTT